MLTNLMRFNDSEIEWLNFMTKIYDCGLSDSMIINATAFVVGIIVLYKN